MDSIMYAELKNKLFELKKKYTSSELKYLRIGGIEQFADILYELESDDSMRKLYGKYLINYVDQFLLTGPSTVNKTFVEKTKGKYYYPVLRYLSKKHKYYRGGWFSILLVFCLPLDICLYLFDLFGEYFLPICTVGYFTKKQIEYYWKKKRGKVLIEDR